MAGLTVTSNVATSASNVSLCANCVVSPTGLRGTNRFQRIQHGACVYCEAKFVRTVRWLKRAASEWKRVSDA